MVDIAPKPSLLMNLRSKTAIVTGGAGGIGAQVVRMMHGQGANVVIADLASSRPLAEELISSSSSSSEFQPVSLPVAQSLSRTPETGSGLRPPAIIFVPTDITVWDQVRDLYNTTVREFGRVDIVIANAAVMETKRFFDFEHDAHGEVVEPKESYATLDVTLKGTMNTLRLAAYHMQKNPIDPIDLSRGSIVLVASTSGYFGATGVVSYVSAKHGIIGLLRSSQLFARENSIRVNAVAPFVTPTDMTGSFADVWLAKGMPANKTEDVAWAIVQTSVDPEMEGQTCLVVNGKMREIEAARATFIPQWMGKEVSETMAMASNFFVEMGGYPLPKPRR